MPECFNLFAVIGQSQSLAISPQVLMVTSFLFQTPAGVSKASRAISDKRNGRLHSTSHGSICARVGNLVLYHDRRAYDSHSRLFLTGLAALSRRHAFTHALKVHERHLQPLVVCYSSLSAVLFWCCRKTSSWALTTLRNILTFVVTLRCISSVSEPQGRYILYWPFEYHSETLLPSHS